MSAPNAYVSSHAEIGFNGCVEEIDTTGDDLKCYVPYKRCFKVSHSTSVFMYCIHSTFGTCSTATYVLNVLDTVITENSEGKDSIVQKSNDCFLSSNDCF